MEHIDVIAEHGKYRVVSVIDDDAQEPYDDGATPILRVDGINAEAFNDQASTLVQGGTDFADIYNHFANYTADADETFERFVKIFHGALKVDWFDSRGWREPKYVAFDTSAWRERMGVDPERLVKEDYLSEVRAWAEGDVYGLVLQKKVTWSTEEEDLEDMDTWEDQDSIWGFYGGEGLDECAKYYWENELSE